MEERFAALLKLIMRICPLGRSEMPDFLSMKCTKME
jgi:hypothetical protein